jgi:hypothetical protein
MSRKIFAGAALFVAILATPASALPIAFDFSGVVQRRTVYDHGTITEDLSGQGQNFNARIVIDTSLMTLSQLDTFPGGRSHWQSTNFLPGPSEVSIDINGAPLAIPLYDLNAYSVTAQDGRLPPGCSVCVVSDSVSLMWRSQQTPPTVGPQLASTFSFNAFEVSPDSTSPSYVNLDTPFDLDSLLTIPLPNIVLQYGTTIFDCEGVNLCFANYFETTWFTTTSVTRTDLSQVSVPEPGTLGLLAAALFGVGFVRRRRLAA